MCGDWTYENYELKNGSRTHKYYEMCSSRHNVSVRKRKYRNMNSAKWSWTKRMPLTKRNIVGFDIVRTPYSILAYETIWDFVELLINTYLKQIFIIK